MGAEVDLVAVDANGAGVDATGQRDVAVQVAGPNRSSEAEVAIVGQREGSSLSVYAMMLSMGPRISSRASRSPLPTSAKTLGSTYQPRSIPGGWPPPVVNRAPLALPWAM
jgi:hypothetical protein